MPTTMVALVSEQRMQNIIPVLQAGADVTEVVLVASTEADNANSRFAQALSDTIAALRALDVNAHEAPSKVDPYDTWATYSVVSEALRHRPDTVVNFTGGTKCMSIGAYMAARDHTAPAIYVDTANERILSFRPDNGFTPNPQAFALRSPLTVQVYLLANGQNLDLAQTTARAFTDNELAIARQLLARWPTCVNTLHALARTIYEPSQPASRHAYDAPTVDLLERAGYIEITAHVPHPTPLGRGFITGRWLEAIVHSLLKDSGDFDDVQSNFVIEGVVNELDGLATRNGQLAVIECKSADKVKQDMLNKLQAISTKLGRFARLFFVTSLSAQEVNDSFRERARQYGVREIITLETLLDIAERVKKGMQGTV